MMEVGAAVTQMSEANKPARHKRKVFKDMVSSGVLRLYNCEGVEFTASHVVDSESST